MTRAGALGASVYSFTLVTVLASGCGRAEPAARPAVRIAEVHFASTPMNAGQRGVLVRAQIVNLDQTAVQVVDAILGAIPESLAVVAAAEPLPYLAPKDTAELSFVGHIDRNAKASVLTVRPRVTFLDVSRDIEWEVEAEAPASVDVAPRGPALIVDTVGDENDLPEGSMTVADAGPTLSLREAILLLNRGVPEERVEFDESVFYVGSGATIEVDGLPALVRAGTVMDATGRSVILQAAPTATPLTAALVSVAAADVTLAGMTLFAPSTTLRAFNSPGLYLASIDARATSCDPYLAQDSLFMVIEASGGVTIEDLAVSPCQYARVQVLDSPGSAMRRSILQATSLLVRASPGFELESVSSTRTGNAAGILVELEASPRSTVRDVTAITTNRPVVSVSASDDVLIEDLDGAGCSGLGCNGAPVTIEASDRVLVRGVNLSEWTWRMLDLGPNANPGAPAATITGVTDAVIVGTASAADGALIEIASIGARWRHVVGTAPVYAGGWSFVPTAPEALASYVVNVIDGARTGPDAEPARALMPSLCPPGKSRYRVDWEVGEIDAWSLINLKHINDFAGPSGFCHLGPLTASVPGQAESLVSIGLVGVTVPELRIWAFRDGDNFGANPSPVTVSVRQGATGVWNDHQFSAPPRVWSMQTSAAPELAGQAEAWLRLTLDLGGAWSNIFVDTVEICEAAP